MNRRIFLRGLGGACVAAPFLGSLVGRGAKARPLSPPKRLILMFTHYGCITTRFFPAKSHGPLTRSDLQATTLAPLAPFVDKLLMPRGVTAMNEWTKDVIRGQGNDPYLQVAASYFTCQPVTPNSDDPFSFDTETKFRAKPIGPSLDHVISQQLSPGATPLLLRVGGSTDGQPSAISYSAAETLPYRGATASELLQSLTGLFMGGPVSPDSYQAVRGKSILDLVQDDLATLQRFDMSRADRTKLEAWKTLLHETTTTMVPGECNEKLAAALGLTQANIDAANGRTADTDRSRPRSPMRSTEQTSTPIWRRWRRFAR